MDNSVSAPIFTANPIVRSTLYRLLSSAFQYPAPEHFIHYQNGDYLSELWDNLTCCRIWRSW